MADFKTNRLSLGSVLMPNSDLVDTAATLYQEFDMARVFDSQVVEVEHVVNFAVLEHLMRGLCTAEEMDRYWTEMPIGIAGKLNAIVGDSSEVSHLAVHRIEEVVSLEDLQQLPPLPAHVTLFESGEEGLVRTISEPDDLGRWAKVACLQVNDVLALLYCPEATFLDGFDPVSGETTEPLVTQDLLETLEDSLFYEQVRQNAFVQTKPQKRQQEIQPKQPKFAFLDSFSHLLKPHLQSKSPVEPERDDFFARPTLKSARSIRPASIKPFRPESPYKEPQKQSNNTLQTMHDIEILPEPLPAPRLALLHRAKQRKRPLDRAPIEPKDPEWAPYERKAKKLGREDCSLDGSCSIS